MELRINIGTASADHEEPSEINRGQFSRNTFLKKAKAERLIDRPT
jgi:hypothetical protein